MELLNKVGKITMKNKTKIIISSLLLSFFIFSPSFAIKSPIGSACTSDSDCESNDCEISTKTDSKGDKLSFCDCGEVNGEWIPFVPETSQTCADTYGGTKEDWTCIDGADASWDLDYCLKKDKSEVKFPIEPTEPSLRDKLLDPTAAVSAIYDKDFKGVPIELSIKIPGLDFSEVKKTEEDVGSYLYIPSLGEYIAAIYRYSVVIASILAVVMIIISGLQWTTSGGNSEKIKNAQKRIAQAIMGMVIAVLSYVLLSTINPELINLKSLKVLYVKNKPLVDYVEGMGNVAIANLQYIAPTFNFTGGTEGMTDPRKKSDTCLMDTFAPGVQLGQKIPSNFSTTIIFMNETPPYTIFRSKIRVHKASVPYWQKAFAEIMSDADPEVVGWLRWLKDFEDGKAPDLSGNFLKPTDKVTSVNLRIMNKPYDTHAMGLAVDIMPNSNWDIYIPDYVKWCNKNGYKIHGRSALDYTGTDGKKHTGECTKYKNTLEKMKSGYYETNGKTTIPLASDPYKMYTRVEKKLASCFNNFDNGKDPFTSIPQRVIDIFAKNGIYWGGYGWTRPGKPVVRTDSMHFEFVGPCLKNP